MCCFCSEFTRLKSSVWKHFAAHASTRSCSSSVSLGTVRSAQIFPKRWWKASSVITSCTVRRSSGSSVSE